MALNTLPAPASAFKSPYSPETRAALAREDDRRADEWAAEDARQCAVSRAVSERMASRKSSLQQAGEALDDAAIRFRRQCARDVIEPTAFARAERRYLTARETYVSLLVEMTGEDLVSLERRVAA